VRAFESALDLVQRLFGGRTADLGPRAGAEALGDLEPKLDAAVGDRRVERLRVGVGDDEVDPLNVGTDHVGDRVTAGPPDSDDANAWPKLVDFRPDEIDAHDRTPSQQGADPST